MKLNTQQTDALYKLSRWQQSGSPQTFYLAGYAGTGKTTLVQTFLDRLPWTCNVVLSAYTGKAASVLTKKTDRQAVTLHSLLYRPDTREADDLKEEIAIVKTTPPSDSRAEQLLALNARLVLLLKNFKSQPRRDPPEADLIVVDECSMIPGDYYRLLLSHGIPVLFIGDQGQLPPVGYSCPLTDRTPDAELTQIMRQGEGSGIIAAAAHARAGRSLTGTDFPDVCMRPMSSGWKTEEVLQFDQIICGKNSTRRAGNRAIRRHLGRLGVYPEAGDKVICLKNIPDLGLHNGSICEVVDDPEIDRDELVMTVRTEDGDVLPDLPVPTAPFDVYDNPETPQVFERHQVPFDFAYLITCHKAQGSEWDKVMLIDQWPKREDYARWLYTGVTRARSSLTIAA